MYCKFIMEGMNDYWNFFLTLDKNIPTTIEEANRYADEGDSAEDRHDIRPSVLLRGKKII